MEWCGDFESSSVYPGTDTLRVADIGNDVLCLDVDPAKIKILEESGIPIYEPGLQEMVKRNVVAGRLHFTTDFERAAHFGTVQFIAVGTLDVSILYRLASFKGVHQ